jgi:hypothetical protein
MKQNSEVGLGLFYDDIVGYYFVLGDGLVDLDLKVHENLGLPDG